MTLSKAEKDRYAKLERNRQKRLRKSITPLNRDEIIAEMQKDPERKIIWPNGLTNFRCSGRVTKQMISELLRNQIIAPFYYNGVVFRGYRLKVESSTI